MASRPVCRPETAACAGKSWHSLDRFQCVRLLGHQPLQTAEERCIAEMYVASFALDPSPPDGPFGDLRSELETPAFHKYVECVVRRFTDLPNAYEAEKCRQILFDLVDRNISELDTRIASHDADILAKAQRTFDRRGFDHSAEGERMRRFEMQCRSQYFQAIALYRKIRGRKKSDDASAATAPESASAASVPEIPKPESPAATLTALGLKMPQQSPEAMKALAEPIGEVIMEILEETPMAWKFLQPYLPASLAAAVGEVSGAHETADSANPIDESLKAAVRPVGELIKDFMAFSPDAADYLRPYLRPPAPPTDHRESTA